MLAPEFGTIAWRKSSHSGGGSSGGDCVETADLASGLAVRDSKDPHGRILRFGREPWAAFIAEVKS
ncbi:DUF397 domain-containing protein, partial [Streptomyces sp. NPDC055078]